MEMLDAMGPWMGDPHRCLLQTECSSELLQITGTTYYASPDFLLEGWQQCLQEMSIPGPYALSTNKCLFLILIARLSEFMRQGIKLFWKVHDNLACIWAVLTLGLKMSRSSSVNIYHSNFIKNILISRLLWKLHKEMQLDYAEPKCASRGSHTTSKWMHWKSV